MIALILIACMAYGLLLLIDTYNGVRALDERTKAIYRKMDRQDLPIWRRKVRAWVLRP